MSIFEKIKNANKKWLYLLFILIILGIGGSAFAFIHDRNDEEKDGNSYLEKANPVYLDLLYLENMDNLKISPEQAKVILPLVEKLDKSTGQKELDLLKSIYSELNPQQYQSILMRDDNDYNKQNDHGKDLGERDYRRGNERDRQESGDREEKRFDEHDNKGDYNNIRQISLSNVIIKDLKERALEQPVKEPVNTPNPVKVVPNNPATK